MADPIYVPIATMVSGTPAIDVPVLIIGGGPVGLSMAVLLERFGVESLVSERSPTTTNHPKARGLMARTMEIFRVWGIEDYVRAGGLPAGSDIIRWCERLSGPFFGTTHPEGTINTPAPKSIVAQNVVEAGLEGALADARFAKIRRQTQIVGLEQTEQGVLALMRDLQSGEEIVVKARFAIACDGASSGVRKRLGIEMDGPPELARFASHYYAAELGHFPYLKGALGYYVIPSDPQSKPFQLLGANPESNRFLYMQRLWNETDEPMSEEQLAALVREHWDMPELEVKRISALTWRVSAQVAQQFRKGDVFLAGDAAHRFSNSGGMGLNSGVQDVHNLAWKLVMVLAGRADDSLLDTYEVERRPMAVSNTNWSTGNFERLARVSELYRRREEEPEAWRAAMIDMDNHLHSEGQAMGFVYTSGALVDDGSPIPPYDPRYYWPTDRPGARFPHIWVDADWRESTIDWFDTAFVLVCGPEARAWLEAGQAYAEKGGAPLQIKSLNALSGPLNIKRDGAILVRPDGHVAWRSPSSSPDPLAQLADVIDYILAGGTQGVSAIPNLRDVHAHRPASAIPR